MFLENTVNHTEQFGWIEVICGSMFSGKTEELIRRLRRAKFAKQRVEIFKPTVARPTARIGTTWALNVYSDVVGTYRYKNNKPIMTIILSNFKGKISLSLK